MNITKWLLYGLFCSLINPLATDDAFWHRLTLAMLSVGAISFEDRFCASRKGVTGGGGWVHPSGWSAWRLALVSAGWAICLLSCTNGHRKRSFHLVGLHFWYFRQRLVWRSVLWLESPDYWTLANEWVWLRSWTHRGCVNKALTHVSSASSKQKWKYRPRKVTIA